MGRHVSDVLFKCKLVRVAFEQEHLSIMVTECTLVCAMSGCVIAICSCLKQVGLG